MTPVKSENRGLPASLIVAALGYFVDVYDIILFSVVRVASLKDLGVEGPELLDTGVFLLNMQMIGMLVGGVLWGIWGDRRGRVSVLFGSILLYSLANLANGAVQSVEAYAVLRFLAGVGLAGELGAGITLVSEIMHSSSRGYGTTLVATVGVLGAVVAGIVGDNTSWRTAYYIGGVLGLCLLVARFAVYESGMFQSAAASDVKRGSLLLLLGSRDRLIRYLSCILTGVPVWFVVGILITFSPEIGAALGATEPVLAGNAVFYCYVGLVLGDLSSGLLSQLLRSRRKVIGLFLVLTAIFTSFFLSLKNPSGQTIYWLCVPLGFSVGYWAVFVSTAAEQFGTNLRATVTTTVPNFVRGATVGLTLLFNYLKPLGVVMSAAIVGAVALSLAGLALLRTDETFARDLDYLER